MEELSRHWACEGIHTNVTCSLWQTETSFRFLVMSTATKYKSVKSQHLRVFCITAPRKPEKLLSANGLSCFTFKCASHSGCGLCLWIQSPRKPIGVQPVSLHHVYSPRTAPCLQFKAKTRPRATHSPLCYTELHSKTKGLEIKTSDGLKGVIVYLKNRNDKTKQQ